MKALVAGLILIVLSGVLLLWRKGLEPPPLSVRVPESTASGMVWKAQRGKATVWLCGSIHLLRDDGFPLPEGYRKAFSESTTVVMELPPGSTRSLETQRTLSLAGLLPRGQTLDKIVSASTWAAIDEWSRKAGKTLAAIQDMKPWMAALTISIMTLDRLGYNVARGMEAQFATAMGDRKGEGLEAPKQLAEFFDAIDAVTQESMILHAIDEEKTAEGRIKELTAAWRAGNAHRLAALMNESINKFPAVKKTLLDDRNAAWIPAIEKHLDGDQTVMILVGSGHLAGEGSLVDLLEKKGVTLTQVKHAPGKLAP